jgi:hypothetical protein
MACEVLILKVLNQEALLKSLAIALVIAVCFVGPRIANASGAHIEIAQGYNGGQVWIDKVVLFTVGKMSDAGGGNTPFNQTCKNGCLQIRTAQDRRCYIAVKDLKDMGIDPIQLGMALRDASSGVWISCLIESSSPELPFHGLAKSFSISTDIRN